MIDGARAVVEHMEKKIQNVLARVWGENDTASMEE